MSEKRLGVPSVEHKLREDLAAMTAARDHYFAAFVRRATLLSEALPYTGLASGGRDLAARITAELETK